MPSKASNRALSVALESISRLKIPRPVAAAPLGNASRPPDRLHATFASLESTATPALQHSARRAP